ncbi:hypothetical protein GLOIN_2v1883107 [Rhizophagus irregularis DAOM 181602=DAOM 197198]|uniref:Ion transport domain-containing protein n=1 Tax=Rhizophagus irregularis (strain DAOM 181602 / DAOM 197198 / MUCL 43194) TaxID=747089 RepID=A0A2P4P9S4_RHIID|nr:hypothetical protein GLOIN_2v1883107 [Rhizophagus irregularis DAOM 181602=DAOM 197198]POG62139.1 hypothetical protein GLOIN_2v1883107 [Rhizophagus irregularis DAOM 181602=DAOM 197198]|eukprot:XP_025169005.1 hypothetical protein GLOIN_2v1883107 [Rhizophagus irregularis DAOM 181602=DAOM 197198]
MDLYIMEDEEQYKDKLQYYKDVFSKPNLPLPNYDSFKSFDKWVSYIIDNKESLLKYGVELFTFAIKEHKLELVEVIYKKCMFYFKKDLKNNRVFLSVITSAMPILNEYYPEYISRYSLETTMIIDSPFYSINHKKNNLHLHSFSLNFQIIDLSFFILIKYSHLLKITLKAAHIFNQYFSKSSKHTLIPMITFMIPYIKFNNYSQNYNWLLKSSPFTKTISKEIFKTWNGEALINFKWNAYGKYYYYTIWIGFLALFGCFIAAIYCNDNIRNPLLIISIILGFFHLFFEILQIIYNPIKWFYDPWNWFDIFVYLLPTYTSIYWLVNHNKNDWIVQLLFYSCLLLDLKLLLFFRIFKSYGIYFSLIINIIKEVYFSLIILMIIIIISFAHATNILLSQDFKTTVFAIYLFFIGDSNALFNLSDEKKPTFLILTVFFTLLIIIYFLIVFIKLFSEINQYQNQNNNFKILQLMLKVKILIKIELFYLTSYQKYWKAWFPEVIYYYADVNKSQKKIIEIIRKNEWNIDESLKIDQNLLKALKIQHNSIIKEFEQIV